MWITAFEKNEFLRNTWFSVHLSNQIRMQTFPEIFPDFYDKIWCDSVSVYLINLVRYQSLSLPWAFTISAAPLKKTKQKQLTWTVSYSNKALMIFHHDVPKSHVPELTFLSFWYILFQEQVTYIADSESSKHACKSHTISAENSLHLLLKAGVNRSNIHIQHIL